MTFISEPRIRPQPAGDVLDQALGVCWVVAEIAVDVFSMLFWLGLALTGFSALTG